MAGKTRVLVTHALHFLPQVDYICVVADGRIVERGTYSELMESGREFSMFVREFGSKDGEGEQSKQEEEIKVEDQPEDEKKKKFTTGAGIMQAEERNTGAVDMTVYKEYLGAARGRFILPFLVFAIVMMQGSTVMSSYWLVYWQEECVSKLLFSISKAYHLIGNGRNLKAFMWVASSPSSKSVLKFAVLDGNLCSPRCYTGYLHVLDGKHVCVDDIFCLSEFTQGTFLDAIEWSNWLTLFRWLLHV